MTTEPKKQINIFIPLQLWKDFSIKCIQQNTSKTQAIIKMIQDFVKHKA